MKQGKGKVTASKEVQIKGTVKMRLTQRINQGSYIKKIAVFDIFSGDGVNIIDDVHIPGSPVEIASAIEESGIYSKIQTYFFASDSRQDAIDSLGYLLGMYPFALAIMQNEAEKQLDYLESYLKESQFNHAILVVDPNGPGALPFERINDLSKYAARLDVIINISENAIRRIKGCRITKGCNWWADYNNFEDILFKLFEPYKEGWIRDSIKGDNQKWRFICMWHWTPPRNAWEKQGLYRVKTKNDILRILKGDVK